MTTQLFRVQVVILNNLIIGVLTSLTGWAFLSSLKGDYLVPGVPPWANILTNSLLFGWMSGTWVRFYKPRHVPCPAVQRYMQFHTGSIVAGIIGLFLHVNTFSTSCLIWMNCIAGATLVVKFGYFLLVEEANAPPENPTDPDELGTVLVFPGAHASKTEQAKGPVRRAA